jgi:hypothetical protein
VQTRNGEGEEARSSIDARSRWTTSPDSFDPAQEGPTPPPSSSSKARGMKDLIKASASPTSFEDIIALVALYRPGPLAVRHGG